MGAGRGKTKRSQSGARPEAAATAKLYKQAKVDATKWKQFLKNAKLEHVSLQDYYVKDANASADERMELIVNELLADLTAVGAVVLPEPYQIADFHFEFAPDGELYASLTTDAGQHTYFTPVIGIRRHFDIRGEMQNTDVGYALVRLTAFITSLINQHEGLA